MQPLCRQAGRTLRISFQKCCGLCRCWGVCPIHFLLNQFRFSIREKGEAHGWTQGGRSGSFWVLWTGWKTKHALAVFHNFGFLWSLLLCLVSKISREGGCSYQNTGKRALLWSYGGSANPAGCSYHDLRPSLNTPGQLLETCGAGWVSRLFGDEEHNLDAKRCPLPRSHSLIQNPTNAVIIVAVC